MTTENMVMQTKKDFEQLFSIQLQQLIAFCQKTKAELNLEHLESIPFCWSIYRQRPQNCYLCFDRTFHFLIAQCPFLLVRECYDKLAELLT